MNHDWHMNPNGYFQYTAANRTLWRCPICEKTTDKYPTYGIEWHVGGCSKVTEQIEWDIRKQKSAIADWESSLLAHKNKLADQEALLARWKKMGVVK